MAWTTLINSLFLPGKKILGSTGMALRDNVIALAAAASGAPRIVKKALDGLYVATVGGTADSYDVIDLAGMEHMRIDLGLERASSGTTAVEFRFSNDNGGSWGSYQTTVSLSVAAQDQGSGCIQLNLRTGLWSGFMTGDTLSHGTGTLTVPTDCNAFSIRCSSTDQVRALIWCHGGRA